jgi:hypothetical protein
MPHDPALVAEVCAWLRKADRDLAAATYELQAAPPFADDIVFHAQQAAEKSLKAFLSWHGIPFRKTHNLVEFARPAARSITAWSGCFAVPPHSPSTRGSSGIPATPPRRPPKRPAWPWLRRARSLIRCWNGYRRVFARNLSRKACGSERPVRSLLSGASSASDGNGAFQHCSPRAATMLFACRSAITGYSGNSICLYSFQTPN